jgi:hypothetical protein
MPSAGVTSAVSCTLKNSNFMQTSVIKESRHAVVALLMHLLDGVSNALQVTAAAAATGVVATGSFVHGAALLLVPFCCC